MESKKKIAIVHFRMVLGGAEKVLVNLLNIIDYSKYSIDLYLVEPLHKNEEGLADLINSNVTIKYLCDLKQSKTDFLYSDLLYDCAIVWQGLTFGLVFETNRHLRAKKKLIWIHGSSSYLKMGQETIMDYLNEYKDADSFFCVSKNVEQDFLSVFPSLENKTQVFYNIIDKDEILKKSQEKSEMPSNSFSILSVGRLTSEKGHILIPKIAKLLSSKHKFEWYILGDGDMRSDIEKEISNQGVGDSVHILGNKTNPYPYIKSCSLLVLPSFTEGYCTVTMEALVLGRPIVATPVGGIFEQIINGETGIIARGATSEDLYSSISYFMSNDNVRRTIYKNIQEQTFDNNEEILKLYDFIENFNPKNTFFNEICQRFLAADKIVRLMRKFKEKIQHILRYKGKIMYR